MGWMGLWFFFSPTLSDLRSEFFWELEKKSGPGPSSRKCTKQSKIGEFVSFGVSIWAERQTEQKTTPTPAVYLGYFDSQ